MAYQQQNRYPGGDDIEMGNYYGQQPPSPSHGDSALPLPEFLNRVEVTRSEIRTLAADIQQLAQLHQRALSSTGSGGANQVQQQLNQATASAQQRNASIREQLQTLKLDAEVTPDSGVGNSTFRRKKGQVESLTADFKREVQNFLAEEQRYKGLCREQIARQYRIVNPDSTPQETQAAVDRNWGEDGVFQSAVGPSPSLFGSRKRARALTMQIAAA